jgi:hypothetical protein
LKFDEKNHLFDGQHRLHACILAGKSFETYVVRGIKDDRAMATVDTGKARSHTDVWSIAGHTNASAMSVVAFMLCLHDQNRLSWSGPIRPRVSRDSPVAAKLKVVPMQASYISKEELLAYGESIIDKLGESVIWAKGTGRKASAVLGIQVAGTLHYLGAKKDLSAIEQFLLDVGAGIGLQAQDPAHTLREHILSRKAKGVKLQRTYILGIAIKAWNARRDGEKVKILRVGEDEKFPKMK